ncbi:MAG: hypothetical protein ACFFA4_05850 [Promethearchaeota archaeon]
MKKESMFIIGATSLTIALIMGILLPDLSVISFFKGMLTGISIVMNISFLIKYRLEKSKDSNGNNRTMQGEQLGK